jgi:hypothetical protein
MFGNKYKGMSVIDSSGMERDLSRRGRFKGSARVDARRGLGSMEGSVGASSGGSGGFMSGLGRRMSSARSTVGEGFGNASRRAYFGGTNMMNSTEEGIRSGAGRVRQGFGGAFNINMEGFGATSGVATRNPMQRAIGAGSSARTSARAPLALGAGPSVSPRAPLALSSGASTVASEAGKARKGFRGRMKGLFDVNMEGFGATSGVATRHPMQKAIGPGSRNSVFPPPNVAGRQFPPPNAAGRQLAPPNLATRRPGPIMARPNVATRKPGPIMTRPNLATKVEMAPPKALNAAIEGDKGKNLGKLMEHMKGNPKAYAIGAGVVGLGALLHGREKRGTSSGAQGMYR